MAGNDKEKRRRPQRDDDDAEMAAPTESDIASLLDSVKTTERPWTLHAGTSVCYHRGRCEICARYVQHLAKEKEERNSSLQEALEELERYWEERAGASRRHKAQLQRSYDEGFDDGYEKACEDEKSRASQMGRGRSLETQQTTTSSLSSRPRSPKGKRPMTSIENELEEKTRELEEMQRRYALATAEISRLRKENVELSATLQSRAIEAAYVDTYAHDHNPMELDYGPPSGVARVGPSGLTGMIMPSNLANPRPSAGPSGTYASVAAEAHKRKATEQVSMAPKAKKPKPQRVLLADARTGLPIPLGREGLPHFSGGPWSQFTLTAPGETLDEKVGWLITHRYAPCYRPVLEEIKMMMRGKARLHPLQRRVLEHRGDAESLYEIAHRNPSKAHKGVRFVDGEPMPADMTTWELVRTIQRSSKGRERTLMLRQTLNEAVLDGNLWKRRSGQSSGICPTPFPEELAVTKANMATHIQKCGVTTEFWDTHLRPFLLRGMEHAPSTTVNADSPEPGQLVTSPPPAIAIAATTGGTSCQSSLASTPPDSPTARLSSRTRSTSAPPNPTRSSGAATTGDTVSPDEDVVMPPAETQADMTDA
jgi:hypothetical protein